MKIVLAFIALSAASIVALGHNRSTVTGNLVVNHTLSQQSKPASVANHALSQQPMPARAPGTTSDSEYGWGPFRVTDW